MEVAAFGCLAAAKFQGVREARPGDLAAAGGGRRAAGGGGGGGDEVELALEQFVAQAADDQESGEQLRVGQRWCTGAGFSVGADAVVLRGDVAEVAGGQAEFWYPVERLGRIFRNLGGEQ
ncbi:hypothetical protein JIX56_46940 [Streptomyces sp. CA-210063]|uniref:hypothetical protein n=1 Tax=Streptomyces sp. CA-210063 TaxID=2801029 RepID=UPI00214CA2F1|nr:hypothetical protein [Streptomyces sp. CA-210063]UUU36743.1 hypothetical protein JIX56_46940 [Streptomyces sp. CA-210063]